MREIFSTRRAEIQQQRLDTGLASHAAAALSKIIAVLPAAARAAADSVAVNAPRLPGDDTVRARLETLRHAVEGRRKLHIAYRDLKDAKSVRTVRPLGCVYWGDLDAGDAVRARHRLSQLSRRP